jgi:hypothetical protein
MAEVNLKVNEKEIPLNEIMESMLKNIILGYLKSMKGIPEDIKTIDITIIP